MTAYIWPLANLVVLSILFFRYARKPIAEFAADYRRKVDEGLESAERERVEAREQLESWRERWEAIDAEITAVMSRARDTARRRTEEMQREAEAEEKHRRARVEDTLKRDREKIARSLRSEATHVLIEATSSALEEVVTGEDQDRLVASFTRELSEMR